MMWKAIGRCYIEPLVSWFYNDSPSKVDCYLCSEYAWAIASFSPAKI